MKRVLSLAMLVALAASAHAQKLGTCKIFPSNNPWNQRIDSLPVHPNSAKFIASVGGSIHVHPDFGSNAAYGIPWVAVNGSQAFVPITITSGWGEEDKGPMPIPANAPIEGGGVGDAHVLVVDTSDHHLYELYQGKKDQSGTGWSATTSAIFGLDSNNYRPDSWTSCDAAGLPIWPGLVRKYECDAGEIKHALRFTVQKTSKGWVFPARHHAGSTTDTTNVMPMGMRFRLKATFDDSKFTGNAKVIATAMKRYGIIMADNGSNWFISGETNTSWDDNDIGQLRAITGNDFEAVYTGPIRTPNTYTKFTDPSLPIPNDNTQSVTMLGTQRDTAWTGTHSLWQFTVQISLSKPLENVYVTDQSVFTLVTLDSIGSSGDVTAHATIRFEPKTPGPYFDTLVFLLVDSSKIEVPIFGLATNGLPHLPQSVDYGKVQLGSSNRMRLKLWNSGNGPLILNALNPGGTSPAFSLVGVMPAKLPPDTLAPGDSVVADIKYTPATIGKDSTIYNLMMSEFPGALNQINVTLRGEGVSSSGVTAARTPTFNIYPNPASGIVTIDAGSEPIRVRVSDVMGRLEMESNSDKLDLRLLSDGTHVIHIATPAVQYDRWVTLQH